MEAVDKWGKLEEIVRSVMREELAALEKRIAAHFGGELERQLSLFSTKGKPGLVGGRWVGISADQMSSWQAAFGALDIDMELKRAAAWILSNPHLAPKQYTRFLHNWLAKSQQQVSLRSIPTGQSNVTPGPGKKLCSYCDKVATGSPNRTWACDDHFRNAMDHDPIPHMRGVPAKAVSGE